MEERKRKEHWEKLSRKVMDLIQDGISEKIRVKDLIKLNSNYGKIN